MGPSDSRIGRVNRAWRGYVRRAGWLLGAWLLTASPALAESWVLHLPMVVGSVAPSDPVHDGWTGPLAQVSPGSHLSQTAQASRSDRPVPGGHWDPVGPLAWHQDARQESRPPASEFFREPGMSTWQTPAPAPGIVPELIRPPAPDPSWDTWNPAGMHEDAVFSQWAEIDPQWESSGEWTWQVMPIGLLYRSYLAGAKEPRFSSYLNRDTELGQIWDASIGARIGLLRYGTTDLIRPEGWQIDLEGGSQARLDPIADSTPLISVDFRVGIPVTWAQGPWQFKTGYYHISAHLGDEFLLLFPDARRLNYTRDSIMLGLGYFWTESIRLYGEVAYAVSANDGAEPWEMQFGIDWVPAYDTGPRGAPFAAINVHLREEVDFNGNLVVQAGWAWRRHARGSLFRTGVQYYRGKSDQYEFFDHSERRIGWGMWADF